MCETTGPRHRKLYHGWVVAIAGSVVIIAAAHFQYIFGVFVRPLADSFGWSRAAISAAATSRSVTSMIFAPLVGAWSDRHGPRIPVLAGVLLVGAAYLAASQTTSLWHLYLSLGFLLGLGLTLGFIPVLGTVARWFGNRSALPLGIVMTGYGVAQIFLPPLVTSLILRYSWEVGFVALALIVWVIGLVAWRYVRNPPPGTTSPPAKADTPGRRQVAAGAGSEFTAAQAMRKPAMWALLAINMGLFLSYQAAIIHVVPAAIDAGITAEAASLILTLSGITNTAGRLGLSLLASRLSIRAVLAAGFGLQAIAVFSLALAQDLYVFYAGAMLYGLTYGGVIAIMPAVTGAYFGTRALGALYGTVNIAQNIGMATGPLLAGHVFDVTGSYFGAFAAAAAALALIFLLCLRLPPPEAPQPPPGGKTLR